MEETNYFRENMKMAGKVMAFGVCGITAGIIFIALFIWLATPNPISPADFARMMKQEGISNAVQEEPQMGLCGEHSSGNSTFTGVKNGEHVSGVLCYEYPTFKVRYF